MEALTKTECALLGVLSRRRSMRSAARAVGMSLTSSARLVQRLEARYGVRLVCRGPSGPALTPYGRVLLRASVDLHDTLEEQATTSRSSGHRVRLASALESQMDVDPLARLDPPLVVDVTETDCAHAIELFDSGSADALALWDVPGASTPARDAVKAPLFEEDLWVVGRDVPTEARCVQDLPASLPWTTTASEADLFTSLLGIPPGSARIHVVEGRHAHRILVLSGRTAGLVPASRRADFQGAGLTQVRLGGLVRRAVLHTEKLGEVYARLERIQDIFLHQLRRMSRPPLVPARRAAPAPSPIPCLDLEDVDVLRVIGRLGSLNRAASELCLTQPALTRRLQKLEERAGTSFVLRTATGSSLTREAALMVEHVDVALGRFRAAVATALPDATPRVSRTKGRTDVARDPHPRTSAGVVGVRPHVPLREIATVDGPGAVAQAQVDLDEDLVTS